MCLQVPPLGAEVKARDRNHWYAAKVVGQREGERGTQIRIHFNGFKSSKGGSDAMDHFIRRS